MALLSSVRGNELILSEYCYFPRFPCYHHLSESSIAAHVLVLHLVAVVVVAVAVAVVVLVVVMMTGMVVSGVVGVVVGRMRMTK